MRIPENSKPVEYTECWCNSPYHTLRWHLNYDLDESNKPVLSFEIYLKNYDSFWKRLKNAIKYIFKNEYTHCGYDEFEVPHEEIKKLKSLCDQADI